MDLRGVGQLSPNILSGKILAAFLPEAALVWLPMTVALEVRRNATLNALGWLSVRCQAGDINDQTGRVGHREQGADLW